MDRAPTYFFLIILIKKKTLFKSFYLFWHGQAIAMSATCQHTSCHQHFNPCLKLVLDRDKDWVLHVILMKVSVVFLCLLTCYESSAKYPLLDLILNFLRSSDWGSLILQKLWIVKLSSHLFYTFLIQTSCLWFKHHASCPSNAHVFICYE